MELQCIRLIASGSFGIVWKMRDHCGTYVAVKEVKADEKDPTTRELIILSKASIKNQNVIELLCHFQSESNMFYVMEIFGTSLHTLLVDDRVRSKLNIELIFRGLFRALKHVHSLNIIHRDIKPQNILVDPSTHHSKLIDFGSAAELQYNNAIGSNSGNQFAPIVGTLEYRAPELLFASTSYSISVDLWSSGCVLAEMLKASPGQLLPALTQCDLFLRMLFLLGAPTQRDIHAMGLQESRDLLLELSNTMKYSNVGTSRVISIDLQPSHDDNRCTMQHYGMDLLRQLMVYSPMERVSAEDALLTSPFFRTGAT